MHAVNISLAPGTEGMGTRRGQKLRLSLVVAGGPRRIMLPSVQDSVPSVFGKSIFATTSLVRNRPFASLRVAYSMDYI